MRTLNKRLLVLHAGLVVLTGVLVGGPAYYLMSREIEREGRERLVTAAEHAAKQTRREIELGRKRLERAGREKELEVFAVKREPAVLRDFFERLREDFSDAALVKPGVGGYTAAWSSTGGEDAWWSKETALVARADANPNRAQVGRVTYGLPSGPQINMAVGLVDFFDENIGVLVVRQPVRGVAGEIVDVEREGGESRLLLDASGGPAAASSPELLSLEVGKTLDPALLERVRRGLVRGETLSLGGVERRSASAPVLEAGLTVLVFIDEATFRETPNALRDGVLIASVVSMLTALLLGRVVGGGLIAPLIALARTARRAAAGDYGADPAWLEREDEVGDLAKAFAGMLKAVRTRVAALSGAAKAAQALAVEEDLFAQASRMLGELGRAVHAQRVYLFENHDGPDGAGLCMSQRFEWTDGSVSVEIDNPVLQNLPYAPDFTRWVEMFERGEPVSGPVEALSESEARILKEQGILSILVSPVFVRGKLWGFIGFDDCAAARVWTEVELDVLATAGVNLVGALLQARMVADLRTERDKLEAASTAVGLGLALVDSKGSVLWANSRFEAEYGDVAALAAFLSRTRPLGAARSAAPGAAHRREVKDHDKNGAERWWEVLWAAMPGDAGLYVAAALPFTDRKLMEFELTEAYKAAQGAAKAKSAFLAAVTHELRTPLNGILGMADLMSVGDLDEESLQNLDLIKDSAKRLLAGVEDVLDLALIESGGLPLQDKEFSPLQVVESAARTKQPAAGAKGIALHFEVSPETPDLVSGDPHRVGQIIHKLVDNAVKFSRSGATTIRVRPVDFDERGGFSTDSVLLEWTVEDGGSGLSPDDLKRVFDRFQQAEEGLARGGAGFGLGLSIVRGLVERMGGELIVRSALGRGSTFGFTAVFGPADFHDEAAYRPARDLPYKVLVVDGRPMQRILSGRLLMRAGAAPVFASDGGEALAMLRLEKPDVVLLDIETPDMDGFEVVRRIRDGEGGVDPDVPVAAATPPLTDRDRETLKERGFDDSLELPIDFERLVQTVEKMMRNRNNRAAVESTLHNTVH